MTFSMPRARNLLLVLALGLLLVSELDSLESMWRRPLFLAHLGAFLIWQPLVAGSRRLNWRDVFLIAGAACVVTLWLNPWIMLVWTALLAALVGGRGFEFAPREERWLHLGALAFLVAFMFALVLPDLLPAARRDAALAPTVRGWIEVAFALVLVVMLGAAWRVWPQRASALQPAGMYDPVHSVATLLLLLLVGFFGLALMTLTGRGYLASIGISLVSVAALLVAADLLLGLASAPRGGGLALTFSRYLLSYGIPYESWLERLAQLSREESDAARFFDLAIRALGRLTPLEGAHWGGAMPEGGFGAADGAHVETFLIPLKAGSRAAVRVRLIPRAALSPSFVWHLKMLVQIAVQFHASKAREERMRVEHYLRAVHETGARVTHDVKNLLQSLDGVIAAAGVLDDDRQVRLLVDRQLPEIGRRLAQTLAKLQAPPGEAQGMVPLSEWWAGVCAQYASQGVDFDGAGLAEDPPVPAALFGSAADNLLQNALQKRKSEAAIAIRVALLARDGRVEFSVEDSGSAVGTETARRLFASPVESRNGLGIGLYQAARQAESAGMRLLLACNRPGYVRFVLTNRAHAEIAAPISIRD